MVQTKLFKCELLNNDCYSLLLIVHQCAKSYNNKCKSASMQFLPQQIKPSNDKTTVNAPIHPFPIYPFGFLSSCHETLASVHCYRASLLSCILESWVLLTVLPSSQIIVRVFEPPILTTVVNSKVNQVGIIHVFLKNQRGYLTGKGQAVCYKQH